MQTKTAGPGSFSGFDLSSVPSPCFVTDLARLEDNLRLLNAVTEASGAHILIALKAFSLWSTAPLVSRYLAGACASGLYEARLARAHYSGLLSCFAPAYKTDEMDELAGLCDHMPAPQIEPGQPAASPVQKRFDHTDYICQFRKTLFT